MLYVYEPDHTTKNNKENQYVLVLTFNNCFAISYTFKTPYGISGLPF